jgi:hypothetical protein
MLGPLALTEPSLKRFPMHDDPLAQPPGTGELALIGQIVQQSLRNSVLDG